MISPTWCVSLHMQKAFPIGLFSLCSCSQFDDFNITAMEVSRMKPSATLERETRQRKDDDDDDEEAERDTWED